MRITIGFYLLLIISGCCKVHCDGTELVVSFEKFAASETDAVSFVSYLPTTGQTQRVDSFLITTPVLPPGTRSSVTQNLSSAYDWKITLPFANKQYIIQNFALTTEKCNCGGKRYKTISSYWVNGLPREGLYLILE